MKIWSSQNCAAIHFSASPLERVDSNLYSCLSLYYSLLSTLAIGFTALPAVTQCYLTMMAVSYEKPFLLHCGIIIVS